MRAVISTDAGMGTMLSEKTLPVIVVLRSHLRYPVWRQKK
jgi:hypothetical protein